VEVLDPHSWVSAQAFNRVLVKTPKKQIDNAIRSIGYTEPNKLTFYYPDLGAKERYDDLLGTKTGYTSIYGKKQREWSTGKILGLDIIGEVRQGCPILMVDDICSYGGTFLHSARKLKELGCGNIYIFVSHCENSILDGELINSGLIEQIFTTDSIYTGKHDFIEVIKL
jgi:ribose-phosphate pyrophosphokinase